MIPNIRIIFRKPDGGVAVTTPTEDLWTDDIDAYVSKIEDRMRDVGAIPDDWVRVSVLHPSSLPSDRTFRDAWECDSEISISLLKAKELTKSRLRAERKPLLENLDVQFMQAMENGKPIDSIVSEKQRLRDITSLVDRVSDLESLKNIKC